MLQMKLLAVLLLLTTASLGFQLSTVRPVRKNKLQKSVAVLPSCFSGSSSFRHQQPLQSSSTDQEQQLMQQEPTISKVDLPEGSQEELLYALGVNLARQLGDVRPLVESGDELAQLAKGVLDTLIGRLTEEGQKDILTRRGEDLKELVGSRAQKIQEKMAQAGQNMLKEMEQTEGATTLPSGVVLHVLETSDSTVRPTKASSVKIHYHGTLADGTIFDSTLGGEPVVLPLAGVIPGWREAVLKLHEGETAMVSMLFLWCDGRLIRFQGGHSSGTRVWCQWYTGRSHPGQLPDFLQGAID